MVSRCWAGTCGRSIAEIAREQENTDFTLRGHIAAILAKLVLPSPIQAALLASEIMGE